MPTHSRYCDHGSPPLSTCLHSPLRIKPRSFWGLQRSLRLCTIVPTPTLVFLQQLCQFPCAGMSLTQQDDSPCSFVITECHLNTFSRVASWLMVPPPSSLASIIPFRVCAPLRPKLFPHLWVSQAWLKEIQLRPCLSPSKSTACFILCCPHTAENMAHHVGFIS